MNEKYEFHTLNNFFRQKNPQKCLTGKKLNTILKLDESGINRIYPKLNKTKTLEFPNDKKTKILNKSKTFTLKNSKIPPNSLKNDILTTYSRYSFKFKKNEIISSSSKFLTRKFNSTITAPFPNRNKIIRYSLIEENMKPYELHNDDDHEKEIKDKLDEKHQDLIKLQKEIKKVLVAYNYDKKVNLKSSDKFYHKIENKMNFKADILLTPYLKNKLIPNNKEKDFYSNSPKIYKPKKYLSVEGDIKKTREETDKFEINPNHIDHNTSKCLSVLKRLFQKEKDSNTKINLNKDNQDVYQDKYDFKFSHFRNLDEWYNREQKEYFTFNIMRYKNIKIVNDDRIKNTVMTFNDQYENFQNLNY